MKHVKRFLLFVAALAVCALIINAKTDFFYNISTYIPALSEYPLVTKMISDASEATASFTSSIPTIPEIIADLRNEELPIDPSDAAHNAYIADSPLLSFYPHENVGILVNDDDSVTVFGIAESEYKRHLLVNFSDADSDELYRTSITVGSDSQFGKTIPIPETAQNRMELTVFSGAREYGQYTSWVLNLVHLVRTQDGGWQLESSPVYENNRMMYERDKSVSEALKSTPSIQSDNASIRSIAEQLTEGMTNDYEKAAALHDWICSYVCYDEDGIVSEETVPYYATDVVKNKRAVCLGFATLYAALCRSINIPCNVVSGYALGIGEDTSWNSDTIATDYQNHAWNEVYADGRWVIVDTTWDSQNRIKNGETTGTDEISHLYFDSNLYFFSQTHKILEYSKRR